MSSTVGISVKLLHEFMREHYLEQPPYLFVVGNYSVMAYNAKVILMTPADIHITACSFIYNGFIVNLATYLHLVH